MKILRITVLFLLVFLTTARAEDSFSWEDCIREAQKNNPDLISAEQAVLQQQAAKSISASSLFPQISADASGSHTQTSLGERKTTSDSYSYGVSGSQLIFDGLKTPLNVQAASQNITAAKEGFRFAASGVRLRLRSAFVNMLRAEEMIKVAEIVSERRRGDLQLIMLRYESGLEHRGAVMNAEANMAQAEFEIRQAKRESLLSQRQLTKEMGKKKFIPIKASGELKVSEDARTEPDFEKIALEHPLLSQSVAKKNAAAFSLKSAYGNFYPKLSADLGAGKTGSHWTPRTNKWDMGLTLSWPLFEGGLRFAQVMQAKAVLSQAGADEQSTKDSLVTSLAETWNVFLDAIDTVMVQEKVLAAAEERAKIAEAQYGTGFITYDTWSIIEDNLVQARKSFVNVQANALLAEANWIQAKGETLEYAKK